MPGDKLGIVRARALAVTILTHFSEVCVDAALKELTINVGGAMEVLLSCHLFQLSKICDDTAFPTWP